MARTIILLMDSFGIGSAHDAADFGDKGSDTLGHIAEWFVEKRKDKDGQVMPLQLPNLAARGLEKAAEQGHAQAQHNVGLIYVYGIGGVPKDDNKGLEWLKKAEAQGVRWDIYNPRFK